SVAGFVGWVEPTDCPGCAPVGSTHPTAVKPALRNGLEPETRAAREADESGALRPCEFVAPDDLPPTGSEPVAVEPAAVGDAPTVTNEASGPAVSGRSASVGPGSPEPALGPIDGRPGPEADGPAASPPTDPEPDDRGRVATNEATAAVDARTNPSGADLPPG